MKDIEAIICVLLLFMAVPDVCRKFGRASLIYPAFVLFGVLLNPLVKPGVHNLFNEAGKIGLILLLFEVGLEIQLPKFRAFLPAVRFALGWAFIQYPILLALAMVAGATLLQAGLCAVALTACSLSMAHPAWKTHPGLDEVSRPRVLETMVALELIAIVLVTVHTTALSNGFSPLILLQLAGILAVVVLIARFSPHLIDLFRTIINRTTHWRLHWLVLLVLGICAVGERLGLSATKTAFILGLCLSRARHHGMELEEYMAPLSQRLLIPLFFVSLGMRVSWLWLASWTAVLAIGSGFLLIAFRELLQKGLWRLPGQRDPQLLLSPNLTIVALGAATLLQAEAPPETIVWILLTGLTTSIASLLLLPAPEPVSPTDTSPPQTLPSKKPPQTPPIRWWPAPVLIVGAMAANLLAREHYSASEQQRNMATGVVVLSAFGLSLLWLVALSRIPLRNRLILLASLAGITALGAATVRVRGVSGDLVPILEWRWSKPTTTTTTTAESPALAPLSSTSHNAVPTPRVSGDFPQFLGPNRDGVLPESILADNWLQHPPRIRWRRPVGTAWSGFAISGSLAVTQEQDGPNERVVCYHVETGRPLWSHSDPARYFTTLAGEGPRATPTIVGNRVFTLGGTGLLNCLDLETGSHIWSIDIIQDNQASLPEWGASGSPLAWRNLIIVNPGGPNGHSLVAYEAETGRKVWNDGDSGASYSSPALRTLAGQQHLVFFGPRNVTGLDPETGRSLWHHPWPGGHPHVAVPVTAGDSRLLVSSGYGYGSELLHITQTDNRWTAQRLWKSNRLKSKFSNPVVLGSHAYGLDDGTLACINLETGALAWKDGRDGHGQVLLSGSLLIISAENGDVVLIEPDPAARIESGRFNVFNSKTWNPPALAGNLLLVRNDKEAACVELPLDRRILRPVP